MFQRVRQALREEVGQLPWLTASAKEEALRKVDAMRDKIGYPSRWREYRSLRITPADFVADLHNAEVLNQKNMLSRIGKPVDEGLFYWTAPEADGNYDPSLNDIEIDAGLIQPPRYSPSADPALNYGGLGTLIGHELTHGLDDEGSLYDEHGNRRDWFTPQDRASFNQMTSCLVKEYDGFDAAPGLKLDGKLSLGENTADNGGIRIAFQALQETIAKSGDGAGFDGGKKDGFTPEQRFFISFGQVWCQNATEQSARVLAKTDPHSSGEWRVKGTVQNFDEFGKAFGCHPGQPMMPTSGGCRVW